MTRRCDHCSFFESAKSYPDVGLCRRYAPRAQAARLSGDEDQEFNDPKRLGTKPIWPVIRNNDWCGDFEMK